MTSIRKLTFTLALPIFSGCAPVHPLVVSETIGPMQSPVAVHQHGSLIVYSDTERPGADPGDYAPHSDYSLYSVDGQLLRSVTNRNAPFGRAPATVQLPVGRYKVVAIAPKFGLISIPVVIANSQTTVVDLISEVYPPADKLQPDAREWVQLPDGQIIGTKAE